LRYPALLTDKATNQRIEANTDLLGGKNLHIKTRTSAWPPLFVARPDTLSVLATQQMPC